MFGDGVFDGDNTGKFPVDLESTIASILRKNRLFRKVILLLPLTFTWYCRFPAPQSPVMLYSNVLDVNHFGFV